MFKNVLMVCVGNICRSPMAEAILKHLLHDKNKETTVHSAGLAALVDAPAEQNVQSILSTHNIDCSNHRARQLSIDLLNQSDLVLVMEKSHYNEIRRLYPSACGKVHLLGKWQNLEIADPYRKSKEYCQETYQLIDQAVTDWQKRLWN